MTGDTSEPDYNTGADKTASLLLILTSAQTLLRQTIPALQAVVSIGFVTRGAIADLAVAKAAYQMALMQYEAAKDSLNAAERATAETILAVIWAAIKTLEASLQARAGEAVDLNALNEAYNQA